MRLRRRAGRPVPPHMDEVYVDLHSLTELVLLLADRLFWEQREPCTPYAPRTKELIVHLRERLAAQEKELEVGPSP